MSSQKFRAISFDAAGTLIHLAEPVGTSYSKVAARYGIDAEPAKLDASFRAVWRKAPLPFTTQSTDWCPDEKSWWRKIVRVVFEHSGVHLPGESEFDEFFESLYAHFECPGTWLADPDALPVLEKISGTFRSIVLSNFDARLRTILGDLGVLDYFEDVILSCETRASKPDPVIFHEAATSLQLAPSEILHVGDDPICDWKGATAAGFGVFKVGRGEKRLGELLDELSLA